MTYSAEGYALTEQFESLRLTAYKDGRGKWTIGYGHTGPMVHEGITITEAEAAQFLAHDVLSAETAVRSYVKPEVLNQNRFDALVDFTFNEGAGNLKESTLLKRVNEGNHAAAADEFLRWVYAAGEIEPGLETRRKAERELYLTPVIDISADHIPGTLDGLTSGKGTPERLANNPIVSG